MVRFVLAVTLMGMLLPVTSMAATTNAEDNIQPGKWEITIHMMMPGMPFNPAPRTMVQCITPQQAGSSLQDAMQTLHGKECRFDDFQYNGTTGHWSMTCTGKHIRSGDVTITTKDKQHYTTHATLKLHDVQNSEMTVTSTAQRLGDCD